MLRPAPKLLIPQTPTIYQKKELPFLLKVAFIVGVEVIKNSLVVAATGYMGPIGAIITKFASDILAGFLEDVLIGEDPFQKNNLTTNLFFAGLGVFRKINTAMRYNKNYLRTLGRMHKESRKEWNLIHKKSTKFVWDKLENGHNLRNYHLLENKRANFLEKELDYVHKKKYGSTLNNLKKMDEKFQKKFDVFNRSLRKFNRVLSYISNPTYLARKFTIYATRKYKKSINNYIKKWMEKFGSKYIKKENQIIYRSLIPLKHTKPHPEFGPWILGIRVWQAQGVFHRVHIQYVFNPKTTNKKPPVILFFRKWEDVMNIIKNSSAGQFYINNVAWGWTIGKIIRNAGMLQVFKNTNAGLITSFFPFISRSLGTIVSTARTMNRFYENIQKLNAKNYAQKFLKGVQKGLLRDLPGNNFIEALSSSIASNDFKYMKRYAKNTSVRLARKRQKKQWTQWANKEVLNYVKVNAQSYKKI